MEKVVFREVTFSFPSSRKIEVNFSQQPKESQILDWSQVFFFSRSILIAKVFRSNLILSQLFICTENSDPIISKAQNMNLTTKIFLPEKILPNIHCEFFDERFQLLVPVFPNQLFKFTLNQDLTIREDNLFECSEVFSIDFKNATCFTFLRSNQEDFEVCFGLNDGRIILATFKSSEDSEPQTPLNVKQVDPPSSLYKKFRAFLLKSQPTEKLIKVVKVGQNLLSLNSFGILRLYDPVQHRFLAELDLELPEIFENKLVTFDGFDDIFVGLGYCKDFKIWVYVVQIKNFELVLESLFTESGLLHDIAVDQEGLWIAFGSFDFSKIVLKPFTQRDAIVYSYHDQVKEQEIIDQDISEQSKNIRNFKKRIFHSGRFQSTWIVETFRKVLKNEEIRWEDLRDLQGFSLEKLKEVLEGLKFIDSQSKEIWTLGASLKVGDFPLVVIRGNEKIGIIRKIEDKVENWDVIIKKLAADCNYLKGVTSEKDFRFWKISFGIAGLDLALLLIRIWRKEVKSWDCKNFTDYLEKAVKRPIPSFFLENIKRLIPAQLESILLEDLEVFLNKFNDSIGRSQLYPNTSWSRFTLQSFGASLLALIESNLDYFTDTNILLTLISQKYLSGLLIEIDSSIIHDYLKVGSFLYALSFVMMNDLSSHSKTLLSNKSLQTIASDLEVFAFPSTVSSLYVYSRSYLLLGANDSFELINFSSWKNNSLHLAMGDLATFIDEGMNSRSFGKNLKNCFRNFRIFPVNLINLMTFYGLFPVIFDFFRSFEDSFEFYYRGLAEINAGRPVEGQKKLIKVKPVFLSGNDDFNEKQLYSCPLVLLPVGLGQTSLSRFESSLLSQVKVGENSLLVLSQLISSSMHADFSQDQLNLLCKSLSESHSFHESYSIIQFNQSKRTYKQLLHNIVEEAVNSNKFFKVLDLNMDCADQEIVSKLLKKKSLEETIDVYSLVTCERFKDQTESLFVDTFSINERETKRGIDWIHACYCFSMRHYKYSDAAAAAFRGLLQVESLIKGLTQNSLEYQFLKNVLIEFLLMTKLAARNIGQVHSKSWFLVQSLNSKYPERTLVTCEQINQLLRKYFSDS